MTLPDVLRPLVDDPRRSAILLDFDGTLSEIVARPELARPVEGARETLRDLACTFGVVAVISGRPTDDVRSLLGIEGVRYLGLYGLEESNPEPVPEELHAFAREVAERIDGAWAEEKGGSVAVHYRQANDPDGARVELLGLLRAGAPDGWEAIEGKMVVELVPADRPRKGGAVRRILDELRPAAVMYAGDDLADLEAFHVLDALDGTRSARVAVAGPETPPDLVEAADHVVQGPNGLVAVLGELLEAAR